MSGKSDEVKGRAKQAVGAVTGDESLKREGQKDELVGDVKQAAKKAADSLKQVAKKVEEAVKGD